MATATNATIINTSTPSQSTVPGGDSRVMPSSPWTSIVRGESSVTSAATATPSSPLSSSPAAAAFTAASEPAALVSSSSSSSMVADDESSDGGKGSNGNAGKSLPWNRPSNGVVEVGPVMGADSWPALSESARVSGKPSQDSSKALSDGPSSTSVPQITGNASLTSQRQSSHNANPNFNPNHTMPARQRSFKRNSGHSASNGSTSQPTGSQSQTGDVHSNNSSPRDHAQRNSQSRNSDDHPQQQRNSFRRNGGPHSRDGSYHHSNGRHDQDRMNQDWNANQNFNGRDAHMQPQGVVPRFMRHPAPSTAPFIGPPPVRAFNPIGFHELAPPIYYIAGPPDALRAVPSFAAPIAHALYIPAPDIQLHSKIVNQIDYYFSNENLIKDTFLRKNMDDQGFVPIKLIAGFKKVLNLTDNIQLILDAISSSTVVEVQGDKVRRRNDWMNWTMPPFLQVPNVPGVRPSNDMLVGGFQSISLEENET